MQPPMEGATTNGNCQGNVKTYSNKSILIPTHPLHVILLRDLIALMQASAARETRRRHVFIVIIFVFFMIMIAAAHGRL